ncbi:MAG: DUF2703 domain-containing protein [Bacillota bacterium]
MKKLFIEWRHLDVDGGTCDRCNKTGENLINEIKFLNKKLNPHGYKILLKETPLKEDKVRESNLILFNGVPIEKIIAIKVSDNYCRSCSDLVGSDTYCRSVYYEGEKYDDIPRKAIRHAILKALGVKVRRP